MDVPISPALRKKRRTRRWLRISAGAVLVTVVTIGLSRLQPAVPHIDKASLYFGTVQRGEMVREVRGNGTLVPEQILFVQAETDGRVERILVQPGAAVSADTLLMELSNPELQQLAFDADWQWKAAEAQLTKLRAQLENDRLTLKASVTALHADSTQAELDARADEALSKDGLVSALETQRARAKADELRER